VSHNVGVYLRESSRRNKDGSKVTYLQLAHNERHPVTGSPVAKVIHNFGRKDKVDKEALARLVSSISRILDLPATGSSVAGSDVEIVDSRRLGGAFVLDQLWERLGIADALRSSAKGRRIDADVVERICFALVAQRCLEPASKLAAVTWAKERVALIDCPDFDDDAAYAAMDFLLGALPEIAERIFTSTANLLNLSCDIIFVDTSSTYLERDVADGEDDLDLAKSAEEKAAGQKLEADDPGPEEQAIRRFNKHSKDHRPDLLTELVTLLSLVRVSRWIGGWVMVLAHGHCQRWGAQGSRDADRAGGRVVGCDRGPLRALPAG